MADNQNQQRDPDVVVYSAFGGVRNDISEERFSPGDLASAINCNIDKSGRLSRRAGYTKIRMGDTHSLWANKAESVCLFAQDGYMKLLNTDYTVSNITVLEDCNSAISYAEINDNIYITNGVDIGIYQAGIYRTWGLGVPELPGVALTGGGMPPGIYQFALTYIRRDGQESGASLAGVVVAQTNTGLVFDMPVSADGDVDKKRLYISTPNGDELYLAFECANSLRAANYNGDVLALDLPLDTQHLGPPPVGQIAAYYRGRMFVAVGEVLYASEPFAYELFDYRNCMQLDGRITMLAVIEDKEGLGATPQNSGFFVGTDRSCGLILGGQPEDFQYVPRTNYGAIAGAMSFVDGSVFGDNSIGARLVPMWLTTQGICVGKPNMEIQNITRSKYNFDYAGRGSALFISGSNRIIFNFNG